MAKSTKVSNTIAMAIGAALPEIEFASVTTSEEFLKELVELGHPQTPAITALLSTMEADQVIQMLKLSEDLEAKTGDSGTDNTRTVIETLETFINRLKSESGVIAGCSPMPKGGSRKPLEAKHYKMIAEALLSNQKMLINDLSKLVMEDDTWDRGNEQSHKETVQGHILRFKAIQLGHLSFDALEEYINGLEVPTDLTANVKKSLIELTKGKEEDSRTRKTARYATFVTNYKALVEA